jgi:hypothetical protein
VQPDDGSDFAGDADINHEEDNASIMKDGLNAISSSNPDM